MVFFKNYEQIFPICEKKHERDRLNSGMHYSQKRNFRVKKLIKLYNLWNKYIKLSNPTVIDIWLVPLFANIWDKSWKNLV